MAVTLAAFILFSRDEIPLRTTCLLIIVCLPLGFYLFPYERDGKVLQPADFFLGFGNEVLITICGLMILGRGLVATGALEPLARALARTWASHPQTSMLLMLLLCLALSGLVNDTPVVVLLLPILMGVALRTRTNLSKMLMPMNFAVLMGGMGTSIGTSTNLLVVSISADLGGPRFGVFDFIHISAIAAVGGILYLWLVAPRLLPGRTMLMSDASPRVFNAVLYINEDSFANGKSLSEVLEKTQNKIKVERIQHDEGFYLALQPKLTLSKGDRLFVADTPENLKEFEKLLGATLYNVSDIEHPVSKEHPLTAEGQQLAEVVVTEG
ncbi:MAG: SLC13 family permease, partial [Burkholderiales bacterium]